MVNAYGSEMPGRLAREARVDYAETIEGKSDRPVFL
jgi:hypothetical protein